MVLNKKPNKGQRYRGGRPKSTISETLDLNNLHGEWDASEDVRERLRSGQGLLVEGQGEDIPAVLANLSVLQPLVTRMSLSETRPLPIVEPLRDEVESVYQKNKRGSYQDETPDIIGLAWRIRKLLGFIKMKVRRHEVSNAPLSHFGFAYISKTLNMFYYLLVSERFWISP